MPESNMAAITTDSLYAGFGRLSRAVLWRWGRRRAIIEDRAHTMRTLSDLNGRLLAGNMIIFFDHHYAFDVLPIAAGVAQQIQNLRHVLIPYAAHLDMGLGQEGQPSLRFWVRTRLFRWLIDRIRNANPTIRFVPVVRDFELRVPRLRAVADRDFSGANVRYLKALVRFFRPGPDRTGRACLLSPIAGLALPGKPALHPQLYRSVETVKQRNNTSLPCFMVGAYPRLDSAHHYVAPLMANHSILAVGPFDLPGNNYDAANAVIARYQEEMRCTAGFDPVASARLQDK